MGAPMVCLPSGSFSHVQTCGAVAWTGTTPTVQSWGTMANFGFALCPRSNTLVITGGDSGGGSLATVWSSPANLGGLSWTARSSLPYIGGNVLVCNAADRLANVCNYGLHHEDYINVSPASSAWTVMPTPFTTRAFCTALLVPSSGHMDHLVMAGDEGTPKPNDVWRYSAASDSYSLVCAAAPWPGRSFAHAAYANDRTLIFAGGYGMDDVWQSLGQSRSTNPRYQIA